jgi:hypothetical protein
MVARKLSTLYGRLLCRHVGAGSKTTAGMFLGLIHLLGVQSTTGTLAAILVHDHSRRGPQSAGGQLVKQQGR